MEEIVFNGFRIDFFYTECGSLGMTIEKENNPEEFVDIFVSPDLEDVIWG